MGARLHSCLLACRPAAGGIRLAQAPQEYGRLVKTNVLLAWLADDELRTRIARQLSKGELTGDKQGFV